MQLMPPTARGLGVTNLETLLDPATNIDTGTRYLGQLSRQFSGNPGLFIPAYNAGPGTVQRLIARYGNTPAAIFPHLPPSTQDYVRAVTGGSSSTAPSSVLSPPRTMAVAAPPIASPSSSADLFQNIYNYVFGGEPEAAPEALPVTAVDPLTIALRSLLR